MKLDIPGTVGKKPPHEGTETVRVVKIRPRPVPFTAAACRKKKGCWPRCACQTLKMCIRNHQTIRLAKHDRRDQAIVRVGRIAVPFRGKLLPADHIDKVIAPRGDDLRNSRPAGALQSCLSGRYGGAVNVVAEFLRRNPSPRRKPLFGK